jgi:hypothetical protein
MLGHVDSQQSLLQERHGIATPTLLLIDRRIQEGRIVRNTWRIILGLGRGGSYEGREICALLSLANA